MTKKTSKRNVPRTAAGAALPPAASSAAPKTGASAILQCAFAPPHLGLALFASVVRALDADRLRVHDTASGAVRAEYSPPRTQITCLDWGCGGPRPDDDDDATAEGGSRKKRRKLDRAVDAPEQSYDGVVVALGTSRAEVLLYAPAEAKVVGTLARGHAGSIVAFKFRDYGRSACAWSLGGDDKLVEWDVQQRSAIRSIALSTSSARALLPLGGAVLVADQVTCLVDPDDQDESVAFPGAAGTVNGLAVRPGEGSAPSAFMASSESSRYVSVYSVRSRSVKGSLIAERDVEAIAFSESGAADPQEAPAQNALAAITSGGLVEVFATPFRNWSSKNKKVHSLKDNASKTRRAEATISVIVSGKTKVQAPIIAVSFQQNELLLAVVEQGISVSFQRLEWFNEQTGALSISGSVQISKVPSHDVDATMTNGVKDMKHTRVDESRAQVSQGGEVLGDDMAIDGPEVIDISSGIEESSESESEEEPVANGVAGHPESDHEEESEQKEADDDADEPAKVLIARADGPAEAAQDPDNEPTFGDLIRAHEPIDVEAAFHAPTSAQALVPTDGERRVQPAPGLSLGTVLAQALRTQDTALLESCLHVPDLHAVRATIERLDAALAPALLQRLAERLHRRPGRAGGLLVWVQWTLVAHGGGLAARPDVARQLAGLHRVVRARARGLQPLLALKGKLDLLEAQMNLRRSMQSQRRRTDGAAGEGVVYVEGQEEDQDTSDSDVYEISSESESAEELDDDDDAEEEEEPSDAEVDAMEVDSGMDEADSDIAANGLIDDEAEESAGEEMGDDGIDVDSGDSDALEEDSSEADDEDNDGSDASASQEVLPSTIPPRVNGIKSRRR